MQSKIKQIVPGLFLFVSITILSSNTFSTETFYGEKSTLLLTGAKKAADACEAVARQKNLKLSIAIVDDSGQLILFRRMSGSSLASVDIALGKAKTAIKLPTVQTGDIGIVNIAIGWQLSVINQNKTSQQKSTPQSTNAMRGIWFLTSIIKFQTLLGSPRKICLVSA